MVPSSKKKVLVTSALLYANGAIHFGHVAGAYLGADVYARFERMQDSDVLFISGSDEYGVAITLSAELAGRTPKEHVDLFHTLNEKLFKKLDIAFDHYSRTTWEKHPLIVHQYFNDLLANGYVQERETEQLYSQEQKRFLADRYVTGTCPHCGFDQARGDECPKCGNSYEATDLINPRSKLNGSALIRCKTKNWFLCLDQFQEKLDTWLLSRSWKPTVLNFAKNYLAHLHPRAITRDFEWGVALPKTTNKVFYVWFEACIGYLSASMQWAEKQGAPERWKEYWCDPDTRLVQFIGKDNIFFHAIFFPAMTMGQNQPYKLVDDLPANEFLNLEGRQFSKSDGWYIDLEDVLTRYSADQIRYALAVNAPETSDSEFTWKDFQLRCNSELLGKYGNLVNRVLVFAQRQCEAKVPPFSSPSEADQRFLQEIEHLAQEAYLAYQRFSLRRACQVVMELATLGNVYFDTHKPWLLAKSPDTIPAMQRVIFCCLECLKTLAVISCPLMPTTASNVWTLLGQSTPLTSWKALATPLASSQPLPPPFILFTKIEDEQIAQELSKLHSLSS